MNDKTPTSPVWVCVCCYVLLVNGEGCHCPRTEHPQPPMSQFADMEVTPGMGWLEHDEQCMRRVVRGQFELIPDGYECDCESDRFSWSPCGGCGSQLGGMREVVTGWISEPPKGLRLSILKGPNHSPNGGLSAHVDYVTLIEVDGKPLPKDSQVFTPSADAPAVKCTTRQIGLDAYPTVYPMDADRTISMASGAFVYTSDSRLRCPYPIPLHDRKEG
jgi:hypothetical protein